MLSEREKERERRGLEWKNQNLEFSQTIWQCCGKSAFPVTYEVIFSHVDFSVYSAYSRGAAREWQKPIYRSVYQSCVFGSDLIVAPQQCKYSELFLGILSQNFSILLRVGGREKTEREKLDSKNYVFTKASITDLNQSD